MLPAPSPLSPPDASDRGPTRPNTRSRAGCWTCREKKVKCDEERPRCRRCLRLDRPCDYEPRARKPYTRRSHHQQLPEQRRSSIASNAASEPAEACSSPLDPYAYSQNTPCSALASIRHSTPGQASDCPPIQVQGDDVLHRPALRRPPLEHAGPSASSSDISEACLAILEPSDFKAIDCFRCVLAPSIDRKEPEMSVLASMWRLAQDSQMVLHMVCAIGAQHSCYHDRQSHDNTTEHHARRVRAAEHYGSSLRLLVVAAAADAGGTRELDLILATLWLMLEYEQRFGDGCGSGLSAHLKGAASVLQGRLPKLRDVIEEEHGALVWKEKQGTNPQTMSDGNDWLISDFASRIVVWISYKDGAAALNGFGGFFNELLGEMMADVSDNYATSLVHGFEALHKRAYRAFSNNWDPKQPQHQLLEDIHSRPLFYLYGNTGQLRFLLSKLVAMREENSSAFESSCRDIVRILNAITDRYIEFIDVAHTLDLESSGAHRTFVINVRTICAHYHATVLCYSRIVKSGAPLDSRQRAALSRIMNIGYQTCADEGEPAVAKLAWPLFVAALESDDALHRTWIMDRYESLCKQGENYRRAYAALKAAFSLQRYHERRIDLLDLLWNTSRLNRFLI